MVSEIVLFQMLAIKIHIWPIFYKTIVYLMSMGYPYENESERRLANIKYQLKYIVCFINLIFSACLHNIIASECICD